MHISRRIRIALFLISLLAAVALSYLPLYAADESEYTIQANTDEVRLVFAASDRQGHLVNSLRSADVAVADNGSIIRQFRSFQPASEIPLDLVLLIDASDSVSVQLPDEIVQVKSFIADSAWNERDRVSILAFGGVRPQMICARNCRTVTATAKLNTLQAGDATPLFDALFEAAGILKQTCDPQTRPALILFSDGRDTISIHSLTDILQEAQNLQSAIYAVNSRSVKSSPGKGDIVLNYLAAGTGGLSFGPGQNVAAILQMILKDLRSGYVLTYELPRHSTGQHSVRILPTSDPKLQFRSRRAYNDIAGQE